MSEVLFEITEENLETGMRGIPTGYCTTSSVNPNKGLFYVGRPVSELANWEPENVIYLLFYGKEGSQEEVADFSADLKRRSGCSAETIKHIRMLPKEGHPMQLFVCALMIAGMFEKTGDYEEDCKNIIAKVPVIVANLINSHAGWPEARASNPGLSYMDNFAQMLNVPGADIESLTSVFKLFNILHYDHGGGNLSVFVGKAVASGLQDMYGSCAAAMSALSGPRHGKANQDCLDFVKQVLEEVGEDATAEQVKKLIRQRLTEKKLIYGFGHAVLRVEDPRAAVFYELAQKKYAEYPLVKIALLLRSVVPKVLGENPKISDPFPNVDGISGTILTAAGFPYPEYFTVLFGLSRVVGIARQVVYERCEARNGKGTPIMRPKYIYKGPSTN
ncbi:MAG: Citrate synthase [Chlamydiae bacterium]|nr:Citrate synthase [Chlamydiota bacterium]